MASAAVATTTNPPSSKEIEEDNPPVDFSSFHLMHDVFKIRGEDPIQRPLLALPQQGVDDFEYFSGKDLDRFTDEAAWHYERAKMPVVGTFKVVEIRSGNRPSKGSSHQKKFLKRRKRSGADHGYS